MEERTMRVFAMLLAVAFGGCCVAPAHAADEFVPLFDGKTLNGWEGDPALWKYLHARFSLPPSRGREAPVAAAPATGKSSERVKNDALALLHKRCSDPAINAFLQANDDHIALLGNAT